ncbi:hypothetical protein TELCIR_16277 [Teladorsagia circumcincta]|uniref:Uncharacterized protein n=1 Tax=Teladorsagia circumcincta TaxID=45464 RepID=A0A2G9TW63_TELCI|nr:hypothetical protein TELCIR_16277 [Teladorsagia circumcincta]
MADKKGKFEQLSGLLCVYAVLTHYMIQPRYPTRYTRRPYWVPTVKIWTTRVNVIELMSTIDILSNSTLNSADIFHEEHSQMAANRGQSADEKTSKGKHGMSNVAAQHNECTTSSYKEDEYEPCPTSEYNQGRRRRRKIGTKKVQDPIQKLPFGMVSF